MRLHFVAGLAMLMLPFGACDSDSGSSTDTSNPPADTTQNTTPQDTSVPVDTTPPTDSGPTDTTPPTDSGPTDTNVVVDCTDDTLAGTESSPADLETVAISSNTFTLCPDTQDFFSVTGADGDILEISVEILGAEPDGANDLDIYLYEGVVSSETEVESSATVGAIESISYAVETPGTFIFVVEGWQGSMSDYKITLSRSKSCVSDGDCDGSDVCYTGVQDEDLLIISQCAAAVNATCGQSTAEDSTTPSTNIGNAASFATIATNGSFTGSICGDDVDAFSFTVPAGGSLIGSISATVTGADDLLAGLLYNAEGDLVDDPIQVDADDDTGSIVLPYMDAGTYTLIVDLVPDGSQTAEISYTIEVAVADSCKLDSDCTNQICGWDGGGPGVYLMCVDEPTGECEADGDNSMTNATVLTSGTAVTSEEACARDLDWYKITVAGAGGINDIKGELTWTGDSDLDLYFFNSDGSPFGAGWWGAGAETIEATALADGTYYFAVDLYADAAGNFDSNTSTPYSLTVTATDGTACGDAADCSAGGTYDDGYDADPTAGLQCNSGTCGRAAAVVDAFAGDTCFSGAGAGAPSECTGESICFTGTCVTFCDDGGQTECDTDFGGANVAYCETEIFTVNVCLPMCGGSHLWSDDECMAAVETSCDTTTNMCVVPEF